MRASRLARVALILLAGILSACGGGGGGSSGSSGGGSGAAGAFTISGDSLSFQATERGGTPPAQTLAITVTGTGTTYVGAGYDKGQTQPGWLTVSISGSGTSYTLQVGVTDANYPPGTYTTTFKVGTADSSGNILQTKPVTVTFTVGLAIGQLTMYPFDGVLGGADGRSTTPATLSFALDNEDTDFPYTISLSTTDGANWLSASPMNGTVGAAGTSIQLMGDRSKVVGGNYTGTVTVTVTVGTQVLTGSQSVNFNVEANRITVGVANGIGLAQTATTSVLSRTITVFSNLDRTDVPWQASSDQPWLTVTPSGLTGGALTVTAAPAGLDPEVTHFATVTIKSSDPTVENQETVRVGLYVTARAPAAVSVLVPAVVLVASPVEPIVFVQDGGTDIFGYNVYTGVLERTLSGVVTQGGPMVISSDGLKLYVFDSSSYGMVEVDTTTGAVGRTFGAGGTAPVYYGSAYIRPAGFPMLIGPWGSTYDLTTGNSSDPVSAGANVSSFAVSPDSSVGANDWGDVFRLVRTALNGGHLLTPQDFVSPQSGGSEVCISSDGKTLFVGARGIDLASHQDELLLQASSYPMTTTATACAVNGEVVIGQQGYDEYPPPDVFVFNGSDGTQLAALDSSSQPGNANMVEHALAVSADSTRVITIDLPNGGNNMEVRFQSLPAHP